MFFRDAPSILDDDIHLNIAFPGPEDTISTSLVFASHSRGRRINVTFFWKTLVHHKKIKLDIIIYDQLSIRSMLIMGNNGINKNIIINALINATYLPD